MQPIAHDGFWQLEICPSSQWPASRQRAWQSGSAVPPMSTVGSAATVYDAPFVSSVTVTLTALSLGETPYTAAAAGYRCSTASSVKPAEKASVGEM